MPDALAVGADYGLTVMNGASAAAYKFAMFILSGKASARSQSTASPRPLCRNRGFRCFA